MIRFAALLLISSVVLSGQTYLPDDPLEFELPPLPVDGVARRQLSDYYDAIIHTMRTPGDLNRSQREPVAAQGVNTLGEPLQGSWWEKRHYYKRMSLHELVAGPGDRHPPSRQAPWTVIGAKSEGISPGFLVRDRSGEVYFIKFDPPGFSEMATGADYVAGRLLHALGYHVPENYLVEFSKDDLVVGSDVMLTDHMGRRRRMLPSDVTKMLLQVGKTKSGLLRATASRAIPGTGIGPYRYYGRRRDDPNDFELHEHRRDLRGLAVICAWIGHDDSRAINTYDALVKENGQSFVRHFLLDLGSTLGSGTQKPNSARSGGEYLFAWKQSAVQLFTLGLAIPRWSRARFPDIPSVGRFEYEAFDPETWVPEYPNPAFLNRLPEDEFWAAKQIMALHDDEIRAIVKSADYSDPGAEAWISKCLIERRNKIGRAYFQKLLPIDKFEVHEGELTFEDLSQTAGFGSAGPYTITWYRLDNVSGLKFPIREATGPALPGSGGPYRVARINSARRPGQTVEVTVRVIDHIPPAVVGVARFEMPPSGTTD